MLFWVHGIAILTVSAVRGFTNKTIIFVIAVCIIISGYYLALVPGPGLPRSMCTLIMRMRQTFEARVFAACA